MRIFKVSVPEMWHRVYSIEAETFAEAVLRYKDEGPDGFEASDPEYIDDISDDGYLGEFVDTEAWRNV